MLAEGSSWEERHPRSAGRKGAGDSRALGGAGLPVLEGILRSQPWVYTGQFRDRIQTHLKTAFLTGYLAVEGDRQHMVRGFVQPREPNFPSA